MRLKTSRRERRRQKVVDLGQASEIMRHLKVDSEEALVRYCQDRQQEFNNRHTACAAIATILGRAAIPFLLQLAGDDESGVVVAAVSSLGSIGSRRSTRPFMRIVRTSKIEVHRQQAIFYLGWLRDRRSENLISRVLLTDVCARTRLLAAEALEMVYCGRRSVPALIQALPDPSPSVRWSILKTLATIGDLYPSDLNAIRKYLTDQAIIPGLPPEEATVASMAQSALNGPPSWAREKRRSR